MNGKRSPKTKISRSRSDEGAVMKSRLFLLISVFLFAMPVSVFAQSSGVAGTCKSYGSEYNADGIVMIMIIAILVGFIPFVLWLRDVDKRHEAAKEKNFQAYRDRLKESFDRGEIGQQEFDKKSRRFEFWADIAKGSGDFFVG